MWNVFLVEDEETVRKRVQKIIPWEKHGFRLAGEAGDGEEAFEQIVRLKPDLIISDIVMPVMDGIELLQKVRQAGIDSQFVMLTCINEFEYARQALEYGAFSYVLKLSMTVEQMEAMLHKVRKKLEEQVKLQDQLLLGKFRQYYEQLWSCLSGSENSGSPPTIPPFPDRNARDVLIVSAIGAGEPFRMIQRSPADKSGEPTKTQAHQFSRHGITTWFVWLERNQAGQADLQLWQWARELPAAVFSLPGQTNRLTARWRSLLTGLNRFWYDGDTGLYPCAEDKGGSGFLDRPSLAWTRERELMQAFEEMKIAEFKRLLEQIWADMAQAATPIVQVKLTAERLLHMFDRMSGKPATDPGEMTACGSHAELLRWLADRAERYMLERIEEQALFTDHPEINKIIHYIQLHYHQEISLESMAKLSAMDKNYLSGLFKRKTGMTLIHYVQKIRLEHAAQLLASTDLPLGDIAERVGIASDNYFIKLFKKWYKTTPAEYKRSQLH